MDKGVTTILFCLFCCVMIFTLPFIVCDLYFAYNDTSTCMNSDILGFSISITLKTWLEVDGWTMFSMVLLMLTAALGSIISAEVGVALLLCTVCLWVIYNVFRFAWLIVGAVMFWGYLSPSATCSEQVNGYMWALLIISLIGVIANFFTSHKARRRDQ